ncbi:MAG: hypothetical protein OXI24_02340 [Candidatus Poribacteria bacterium]|nr:hypothetical protein [Candidatus Poribacteria bacterium]
MKLTVEEYLKFRSQVIDKIDIQRYKLDMNEKLVHRILPKNISQKDIEGNIVLEVPLQDMIQLFNALD